MFTQRNVQNLFIGDSPVALATGNLADINVGQVAAFTTEGIRLTTTTALTATKMVIGMKLPNGKILTSDVIEKSKVVDANAKNSVAAVEQVDILGYNGTSGSIDVTNDNLYKLNIYVEEFLQSNTDGKKVKFAMHKSSLAATQQEIALGLASSVIYNFTREPEKFITAEVLNSGSVQTASTQAITVVNGSTKATTSALPGGVVAGDLLRIGTGGSAPVYRIESYVGTTLTLDRPYQGASATIASGGANHNYILAVNIGANYGVKLTGNPLTFIVGKKRYQKARWTLNPVDFGDTTITHVSAAAPGSGRYEQVSELEWFTFGNEGEYFRRGEPTIFRFRDIAKSAFGYGLVNITFEDESLSGFSKDVSPKLLTIAIPDGADLPAYANGTGATDLLGVIAAFTGKTIAL